MSQPDSDNPFASPRAISPSTELGLGTPDDSWIAAAADQLRRTQPWARLVAIVLLGLGALDALGLAVVAIAAVIPSDRAQNDLMANFVALLLTSAVLLVGGTLLWNYTRRIGDFLNTRDQHGFENALAAHATVWRFWGIVVIVFLVLMLLVVLFVAARHIV